jgi:ankyrin repeat protein
MINKKNYSGKTALHLASSKGYTNLANDLILNGADAAPLDHDNITPLHEACKNGHVDTVELLLDRTHKTLSHNDVSSTPCLSGVRTHISGDRN